MGDAEQADFRQRAAGNTYPRQARRHPPARPATPAPARGSFPAFPGPQRSHRRCRWHGSPTEGHLARVTQAALRCLSQEKAASAAGVQSQGCPLRCSSSQPRGPTSTHPTAACSRPPARPHTRRHATRQSVRTEETKHSARCPEPLPSNVQD